MNSRNTRRENYQREGLIFSSRKVQHPGQRAALYQPAPDTSKREKVITPYLKQGHSYRETAQELILLGFAPVLASDIRALLVSYCDAMLKAANPYQRTRGAVLKPDGAIRAQIVRSVPNFLAHKAIPDTDREVRDGAILAMMGANGVLPEHYHGDPLPDDTFLNWKRLRDLATNPAITEAQLRQALADARERTSEEEAARYAAWVHARYNITPDEFSHALLPGHICTRRHTPAQAMLPYAMLGLLHPGRANPAAWRLDPYFPDEDSIYGTSLDAGMSAVGRMLASNRGEPPIA
jgi:hypothetical protein